MQRLEIGIMVGFTVSPLAFTTAMYVIIRASKLVVGRERWQEMMHLSSVRSYMDNMTMVTTTVPCIKRLLERINKNLKWAGMKIKKHLVIEVVVFGLYPRLMWPLSISEFTIS